MVLGARDLAAEEDGVGVLAEGDRAEVAHAPVADHLAGETRGLLDVARGAVGNLAGDDLLADAAGHRHADIVEQALAGIAEDFFGRHEHGHAEGATARDDGDLVERQRAVVDEGLHDGMASLMVGRVLQIGLVHDLLTLATIGNLVAGFLDVGHLDLLAIATSRMERAFVEQVGEVGAGHAGGEARDALELDGRRELETLGMHGEDGFAAAEVGQVYEDLTVETAGTQQRGVEDVRTIGGTDDDHAGLAVETVHLDEQRIQGLLTLVVTAADAGAALTADRVDLIDEDDAGGELAGLLEGVAHAGRADADEHLDEVGAADAEERHAGLAGDRAGEQRLARTGRTDHEHALGDARADLGETLRILQEVDDLLHLFLGLVAAGDVLESGGLLVGRVEAGAGLRELHRAAVGVLQEAIHHEQHHARDEERGQHVVEEHRPPGLGGDFLESVAGDRGAQDFELFLRQVAVGVETRLLVFLGAGDFELAGDMHPALGASGRIRLEGEVLDLLLLGVGKDLGDLQLLDGVTGVRAGDVEKGDDGGHQQQPDQHGLGVHSGAVFIIIRLVVLTHGQRF